MTPFELQQQGIERACMGNAAAIEFVWRWAKYCHAIDDIEDEVTTPEFRLGTFVQALEVYTCPFFKQHEAALKPLVYLITNQYADSVAWEKSKEQWKREYSEWARHCGAEMVLAVAGIVGGYQHMRAISLELRTVNYAEHFTETPSPARQPTKDTNENETK